MLAMSEKIGIYMIVPIDWNILSFDPCTINNYEDFNTLFTTPKKWVAYYM